MLQQEVETTLRNAHAPFNSNFPGMHTTAIQMRFPSLAPLILRFCVKPRKLNVIKFSLELAMIMWVELC